MPNRDDTAIFDSLSKYVALIGRGQQSGKTMSLAQANDMMTRLLNGEALPEQTGALLMLLRMREETSEELSGFLKACRNTLPVALPFTGKIDLDLGCYAGKRRHLPWFVLAVKLLAQNGYKVFLHGLEENDSNRLYLDSVFNTLAMPIATKVNEASEMLEQHNFCYMSIKHLHPAMADLLATRHILGLRSCMHSVAKMFNPAGASASLHGVFHRELDNTHINVASILNDTNVACIRGDSGEVEATPEKAFKMQGINKNGPYTLSFPVALQQWSVQTRQLGVGALLNVWQGSTYSPYGEAATITTLAVYLCCIHNISEHEALERAEGMWQRRANA